MQHKNVYSVLKERGEWQRSGRGRGLIRPSFVLSLRKRFIIFTWRLYVLKIARSNQRSYHRSRHEEHRFGYTHKWEGWEGHPHRSRIRHDGRPLAEGWHASVDEDNLSDHNVAKLVEDGMS